MAYGCRVCGKEHEPGECRTMFGSSVPGSVPVATRPIERPASLEEWVRGDSNPAARVLRPPVARIQPVSPSSSPRHPMVVPSRTPVTLTPHPTPGSAGASDEELIGAVLGNFRIVERLGAGGMGTVYLGQNELIGSKVAVKVLHPSLASDPVLVARFHAEARAANLVGHENLVRIFDLNRLPNGGYYLVMEYLEGQPLSALLGTPLTPARAVAILSQACQAIAAAHEQRVVHRDLKPENIFLLRNGEREDFVKVVDFGIAKLHSTRSGITATGTITGTPEYMAPEQWEGAELDHRVDIYALGVTAWAILAGEPPFRGEPLSLYVQHCTKPPPGLRQRNPEVSRALEQAILIALDKDKDKRWADGKAMARALEQALVTPDVLSTPPSARARPAPARLELDARLEVPGQAPVAARASDLSKAGAFLQVVEPYPPLRARVTVTLEAGSVTIHTMAEVVRHITPQEARAWKMPVGVAVQFVQPSQRFVDVLASLLSGSSPTNSPPPEDPEVSRLLRELEGRKGNDPYRLLGLGPDAEQADIARRLRHLADRSVQFRRKVLPAAQLERLKAAMARVETADRLIGKPSSRAAYDAAQGNFRGVTRCIAAGLNATEVEALRAEFLKSHPQAESKAQVQAMSARARARQGDTDGALRDWEGALRQDPLNLSHHQEYWSLMRTCAR